MHRLSPIFCLLLLAILSLVPWCRSQMAAYDMVVAQDGSGDYTTVQAALDAVPDYKKARTTIFIKAGTYDEKLLLIKSKHRVTLVGEDRDTTILTHADHATINPDESVTGTETSSTIYVRGKDFGAMNLTFANTAGNVGPAIALWVHGSHPHFHNCAFRGYQDTLCISSQEAYFKKCYIEGAIDFIFNRSTAVFKGCTIFCVDSGFITAADTDPGKPYGFVFKNCRITGSAPAGSVYLGRPWGEYAKVAYLGCAMDDVIAPEGWTEWSDEDSLDDVSFSECGNSGAGADPDGRVEWSHQLSPQDAGGYTMRNIFALPAAPLATAMLYQTPTPWYEDF